MENLEQKHASGKAHSEKVLRHHNSLFATVQELRKLALSQHHHLKNLYQKIASQSLEIAGMKTDIESSRLSKEKVREIIDEVLGLDSLNQSIQATQEEIAELRKHHSELLRSHLELAQKHHEFAAVQAQALPQQQPRLEMKELTEKLGRLVERRSLAHEKILKKIAKNTKAYVHTIALSLIKKYGQRTASQLKEMIVDEQGLCSKSSFYRLLEEIEQDPDIAVIREGREKKYLAKLPVAQKVREKPRKK